MDTQNGTGPKVRGVGLGLPSILPISPKNSSHCFKILLSDVSRFAFGVLEYGAGGGDGSGGMDEGGFDLTEEEKGLDHHLVSTMSETQQFSLLSKWKTKPRTLLNP